MTPKPKKKIKAIKAWAITYDGDKYPEIFYYKGMAENEATQYHYPVKVVPVEIKILNK